MFKSPTIAKLHPKYKITGWIKTTPLNKLGRGVGLLVTKNSLVVKAPHSPRLSQNTHHRKVSRNSPPQVLTANKKLLKSTNAHAGLVNKNNQLLNSGSPSHAREEIF